MHYQMHILKAHVALQFRISAAASPESPPCPFNAPEGPPRSQQGSPQEAREGTYQIIFFLINVNPNADV